MAVKKSELYSSIWASCDELRGGMDASQYKDYVLVLLFVKYVSDRYAGQPYAAITIPKGASFADMVALKGKPDIGDQINKKILGPLAQANHLSDMPDFNDPAKLGSGKEMVERLTNLIAIFENPDLDFSKNRADGDDLLGDAYEYLMRHFATESGKSKGQFYTPAEVSRVIAQILGIRRAGATANTTVYDPTCGSGSLLLKVADEAAHGRDVRVTLYGQEKDSSTAGLARMNMILHDYATAEIKQGNTLANPLYKDRAAPLEEELAEEHGGEGGLSVHPPSGRVRIAAPRHLSADAIRAFAVGKLGWIRKQRRKLQEQERETPREYLDRETHYVWGRRCLLRVVEHAAPPRVEWRQNRLVLFVRPGTEANRRGDALEAWYRDQLRQVVAPLLARWQPRLGVRVERLFVQRMRTRWGSCNPAARSIRLNTDLAKKPGECLEFILVHELLHLIEPSHNARFVTLMDRSLPGWPQRRELLNRLPLRHDDWGY